MILRAALVQLNSCDDPAANLKLIEAYIREAHKGGATLIATPEASNIISKSRSHQNNVLRLEELDQTLARLRCVAKELSVWLLIGSLILKTDDADGRFANRSFLVGPTGDIAAWYDKIHMFDVQLGAGEKYLESAQFRPGNRAVIAKTDFGKLGLTICYDLRFGHLHRELAKAGAKIITSPAAFTVPTGKAHWGVLLRARAIETGCFILAPAQCGTHAQGRKTFGHSIAVDPWGRVIAQAGTTPGVTFVDLDLNLVNEARGKIPALTHDRGFTLDDSQE